MKSKMVKIVLLMLLFATSVSFGDFPVANQSDDQLAPRAAYSIQLDEFLVVYEDEFSMDDEDGINAVRILPNGTIGPEIMLNDPTSFALRNPDVAYDCHPADQMFLVVWDSTSASGDRNIYGAFVPAGENYAYTPFIINDSSMDDHHARVEYNLAADEFIVVWERSYSGSGDSDIIGQRLDYSGYPIGSERVIANSTGIAQHRPDIATNITVNPVCPYVPPTYPTFIVTWYTGNGDAIEYRAINYVDADNDGWFEDVAAEDVQTLASSSMNRLRNPSIAANTQNGEFFVAWENEDYTSPDNTTICGRFINKTRLPLGGVKAIAGQDTYQNKKHLLPDVAFDPYNSTFSIVYELHQRLTDINIHLSRITSIGTKIDGEMLVTTLTRNLERKPAVVTDICGYNLVVWEDNRNECCGFDIYGKMLDLTATHDYGDAPNQYYTLVYPTLDDDSGAKHLVNPEICLGEDVDAESDGLPTMMANGDDIHKVDDEDGVKFPNRPLVPGNMTTIEVMVKTNASNTRLYGWVDFNRDGSWAEVGDQIFDGVMVNNGMNTLSFMVPKTASPNRDTYARLRLTSQSESISYYGEASDGEVEDYKVLIGKRCDIKWVQPVEEQYYGVDIKVSIEDNPCIEEPCEDYNLYPLLADDFLCTQHDLISKVTLWGSWKDDNIGQIKNVRLYIFCDVPESNDEYGIETSEPYYPFSRPGKLLWSKVLDSRCINMSLHKELPTTGEYWWDALAYVKDSNNLALCNNDHQIYQIEIAIPEEEAFLQQGTCEKPVIYWLGVQAEVSDGAQLGWKTRRWPTHYNDDAVLRYSCEALCESPCASYDCTPPVFHYEELKYPKCHDIFEEYPPESHSIDLAFMLEAPSNCPVTPVEPKLCPDYNGDNFVNFEDLAIFSSYWLQYCDQEYPEP